MQNNCDNATNLHLNSNILASFVKPNPLCCRYFKA